MASLLHFIQSSIKMTQVLLDSLILSNDASLKIFSQLGIHGLNHWISKKQQILNKNRLKKY